MYRIPRNAIILMTVVGFFALCAIMWDLTSYDSMILDILSPQEKIEDRSAPGSRR